MIHPEGIRQKALNLYPDWQIAWLGGDDFFPKVVPCEKRLDQRPGVAIESIRRLRAGSKEALGYGYSVEWKERNSRRHGRNRFPERIVFQTENDFLRLIGKQREFSSFTAAVRQIRSRFPQLEPWIRSHRQELVDVAPELEGLLAVVDYFVAHPRPDRFARELPLPVDTKFIERNSSILRVWLDTVLAPGAIRADEEHFARRFGLRYMDQLIFVRFLDAELQERSRSLWKECKVPLHHLADTPIECRRLLIVENKVNLLTLPPIAGAIGLGGLGNSVTDLRYVTWLADKELWYWGDVDVEGFEILSRLRAVFPQVRSLMMDAATITAWRDALGRPGSGRHPATPAVLTASESLAFDVCAREDVRIEQERLRQDDVLRALAGAALIPAETSSIQPL